MRKFKEVLRLKYGHHLTNRKIAKSCAMSHVTVGKYLDLAKQAGIIHVLMRRLQKHQPGNCRPFPQCHSTVGQHPRSPGLF